MEFPHIIINYYRLKSKFDEISFVSMDSRTVKLLCIVRVGSTLKDVTIL